MFSYSVTGKPNLTANCCNLQSVMISFPKIDDKVKRIYCMDKQQIKQIIAMNRKGIAVLIYSYRTFSW